MRSGPIPIANEKREKRREKRGHNPPSPTSSFLLSHSSFCLLAPRAADFGFKRLKLLVNLVGAGRRGGRAGRGSRHGCRGGLEAHRLFHPLKLGVGRAMRRDIVERGDAAIELLLGELSA